MCLIILILIIFVLGLLGCYIVVSKQVDPSCQVFDMIFVPLYATSV